MSKKHRKKSQKKSFPWVLLALGGVLITAAIFLFANRGSGAGCGPPQLTIGSMALKPGESTTVQSSEFMMHEGMDGPHNFAVHLKTNAPDNSDLVVNVISDWGP